MRRGLCGVHYKRLMRHGDPLAGRTPKGEPLAWIGTVAIPHEGGECLIWPFYRRPDGRAAMNAGVGDDGSWLVHHRICERVHGAPPSSEHIACHSCGNGHEGCVNSGHLYWGTHADNQQDMIEHGRSTRGEKALNAKLTEDDVRAIRAMVESTTQQEVAEKFGVHIMTINDIVHRRSWGWLE